MPTEATYVTVAGPQPTTNRYGDEIPRWYVVVYDEDDCELNAYEFTQLNDARHCGIKLSIAHDIELVDEAMAA